MKDLFLFTNSFPCNKALEHYIEHEMPFLSQSYKRIFILPGSYGEIKIPVPANVEVLDIYSPVYYKGNKLSFVLNLPLILSLFLYEFFNTRLGKAYWLSKSWTNIVTLNNAVESAKALRNILVLKKCDKNESSFYSYWFYHSALILSVAKKKGYISSFLSRGHQAEIYEEQEPHKSLFKNLKLRYVNKLCLISQHAANYMSRAYPNAISKYGVSYLGVKDNGLNASEKKVFTIVSCSKYAPHKRMHLIPQILKHLDFEYHWYHLGYVPDEAQAEFNAMLVANNKKRVFFTGDYPNHKVLEFYKNTHVDLFINTSSIEGLSVALMEAGSFGITLMATDINGTAEIVNEKSGYLLPLDFDPGKAAAIVKKIYSDPAFEKRGSAREMFLERFDSSKNFKRFIAESIQVS